MSCKIVVDQRYVKKPDGKKYLQYRCIKDVGTDASGSMNLVGGSYTGWKDVPLCLDEWDEDDE